MSRPKRIHSPGLLYHVTNRGRDGRTIFHDEEDFEYFIKLIAEARADMGFRLYAYALMPDHFHLLIEVSDRPLSRIMKPIAQRYAQYFNVRYGNSGPLFHGPYRTIICEKEKYLLELVRYVHLNPVRSKIATRAEDYKWTSHILYLSGREGSPVDSGEVLAKLGGGYQAFIEAGISHGHREDLYEVRMKQVLGGDEFLGSLPTSPADSFRRPPLADIEAAFARRFGVAEGSISSPTKERKASLARGLMSIAAFELGYSHAEIGAYLKRTPSGMTRIIQKTKPKMAKDPLFRSAIDEVLAVLSG